MADSLQIFMMLNFKALNRVAHWIDAIPDSFVVFSY